MAVSESKKTVEENENAAKAENDASKPEKAANGAQTQPRTENKEPDTVKLVYIGPSLPKAMLKSNTVFEGTKEGIKKELAEVLEKFPLVEKLIVPVKELGEKKEKVRTAGNLLNKYYSDIVSAASAMIEKEV